MRLWTIHPAQLDRRALVAGWREALLAQKVLQGATKGYTNHPQLVRFRAMPDAMAAITTYLHTLADESDARSYRFNRELIVREPDSALRMTVTDGQLSYEWDHLCRKVIERDPDWAREVLTQSTPRANPMFDVVVGDVAEWEIR